MKSRLCLFRALGILFLLSFGIFSCQEDEFIQPTTVENFLTIDVPELSEDFVCHFTQDQLTKFLNGPQKYGDQIVKPRKHQMWHPIIASGDELVYSMPLLSDCDDPNMVLCENPPVECPSPPMWSGIYIHSEGSGIWKGFGAFEESVQGVACMPSGEFFQEVFYMRRKDDGIYAYGDNVKLLGGEVNDEGINVSYWEMTFTEGTGKLEGAHGYSNVTVYSYGESNPITGDPAYTEFYALGWVYY